MKKFSVKCEDLVWQTCGAVNRWQRIRDSCESESIGPVDMLGRDRPTPEARLLGSAEVSRQPNGAANPRPSCVGRSRQILPTGPLRNALRVGLALGDGSCRDKWPERLGDFSWSWFHL